MSRTTQSTSRREFLKDTGRVALGAGAVGGQCPNRPRRRRQHDPPGPDRLRRRGAGPWATRCRSRTRAGQALRDGRPRREPNGRPRTRRSAKQFADKVDVPEDRKFSASTPIARRSTCSGPATSPCAPRRSYIRPVHVEYAVRKGINVFMEKPFASDPGGLHRMLRGGRRGGEEGRQDRGRTAMPPLAGAAGADREDPRRRDGRASRSSAPTGSGGAGWLGNQGDRRPTS